jgi:hypothetical protein
MQTALRHKDARTTLDYELDDTRRRKHAAAKLEELLAVSLGSTCGVKRASNSDVQEWGSPATDEVESDD